ncbi:hypothetical protein [Oceanirhabdus seepicola]|uniref:Uncharacterized protein n=1 Tax=Oceanirhabdus seepicola TaxID=2828781 RepID=A0A9J6P279_9CLOT|nr:hypothetical protein [Oceanirhabdus seepicola]MCM1990508.1 hypothetical protein [Oceanirhabdus seepicola]
MRIEKCKWKNNADSPVLLMIDDFANTWIDENNNEKLALGEDWGHFGREKNSMWDVLEKNIFNIFPEVSTTLFTVVGEREPILKNNNKKIYSKSILEDEKFVRFLNDINKKKNVEIAYHGLTHGVAGETRFDFKEEWETFGSLNQAIETIEKGKEMLYKAIGEYPKGGKYCGYKFNQYSDESISKTGFLWWCRHWDAALEENITNKNFNYELETFHDVIDIPSTIDGSFYSLKNHKKIFTKKYAKSILEKIKKRKSIEFLLDERVSNKQIISIQEHSSPLRADNRIQYPNIISDLENLQYIFAYLKKYNLWYATGTEIAEYYYIYCKTHIKLKNENTFIINTEEDLEGRELTIKINRNTQSQFLSVTIKNQKFILNKSNGYYMGDIKIYNDFPYVIEEG